MGRRPHSNNQKSIMNWGLLILSLLAFVALAKSATPSQVFSTTSSYITDGDRVRMKQILDEGYQFKDLSAAHSLVVGYQSMSERITRTAEICRFLIESAGKPALTPEQVYYIASTWKMLGVCQIKSLPVSSLVKVIKPIAESSVSTLQDLYYSVHSLVALGEKLNNSEKIAENVKNNVNKDKNVINLAHAKHIAVELGSHGKFAFNYISEALKQADEVDGKALQYEGGLTVTSTVINGIYKLASALKQNPALSNNQTVKFANYFLSRRSVQHPKGVANLLSSLRHLATNDYEKPVCITLGDDSMILSAKQPLLKVKVCDGFGKALPSVSSVTVNSVMKEGSTPVLSKKVMQGISNDKTSHTLNLMTENPDPGFYSVSVQSGSLQNTVTVKVMTDIKVDNLEIGTADADQTTTAKLVKISHPQKLSEIIEADSQQKLVIRFSLKESIKNKAIRVHQAFVRLSSVSSGENQEIIFVADPDPSHVYKFDMPVATAGKMFNYQSGEYNIGLIVGDAVMSNPFQWSLATVHLKFPAHVVAEAEKNFKQKPNIYVPKPEIEHLFREPEKRPPTFVSNLFTALCLAPILILLILWANLRINVSSFPFSLSAFFFHLGLGSIFALFGIFWLHLNMFTTLRYLIALGAITFFSGNKLLSYIASQRK